MGEDEIRAARAKIVTALADHGKMYWSMSTKNPSATLDGATFIVVLAFSVERGQWITSAVSIVDGSADRVEWGKDPRRPIEAAEHWVRTEH